MTLWSGRVETELAPEVWSFLRADDAELLPYDLEATLLHAHRLHAAGILDDDDLSEVTAKLATIQEIEPADEEDRQILREEIAVAEKELASRRRG